MASPAPELFRTLRRVEYDQLVALGTFQGERIELIAGLYASCGVPEYWVVNLVDGVVEVHREPADDGYRSVTRAPKGARLRLLAFPDVELAVDHFVR